MLVKLTVATALFRLNGRQGPEILTQLRVVRDPVVYDPLYNMTREAVAETLPIAPKPAEHFLDAARRGIEEELGSSATEVVFYGADFEPIVGDAKYFTTRPGKDLYAYGEPLLVTLTMKGPQPWVSVGFAGEVPSDWSPDMTKADGEAMQPLWLTPAELLADLDEHPENFFGLTYQLLKKVAIELS